MSAVPARACLVALTLLTACAESPVDDTPEDPRIPIVGTITLVPQPWTQEIDGFGVVEPAEQIVIAPDFLGTVVDVGFDDGDTVAAGQPLVRFDAAKRALRLEEAEADLAALRAELEDAQENLARRRQLLDRGTVSIETFQAYQTTVRAARARVAQAAAARNLARRNLDDMTLVSPAAGVIMERSVDPGETVLAGARLAVIDATETMRVVTYVTEKDVNALNIGAAARVTTAGVPGRIYHGRIEVIDYTADPSTGTFPVKVAVANDDGLLRHGMTARVTLTGLEDRAALIVPRAALADRNRRRLVFKVEDGRAHAVEPLFAAGLGDTLPVLEGLDAGDQIITDGVERVVDGSFVKATPSADAEPPAGMDPAR